MHGLTTIKRLNAAVLPAPAALQISAVVQDKINRQNAAVAPKTDSIYDYPTIGLTRDQARDAMITIDYFRTTIVRDIKNLDRRIKKSQSSYGGVLIAQRDAANKHLAQLLVMHQALGEAFNLGGY